MTVPARYRPLLGAIAGLLFGIVVVGVIVTTLQTRGLVGAIRETQKNNTSTFDLLVDCTSPGGDCFEAGQKRTGEAVGGINQSTADVIVAALSCQADGITGRRPLARCTAQRAGE